MRRCEICLAKLDRGHRFCPRCGASPDAQPIELLSLEHSAVPAELEPAQTSPLRRRFGVLILAGVIAAPLVALSFLSSGSRTDPIPEPDPPAAESPPASLFGVATVETPESSRSGDEVLVTIDDSTLRIVDLADGSDTSISAPESLIAAGTATLEGHVVVVGATTAWAIDIVTGAPTPLRPAETVLPSSRHDRVWVGTSRPDEYFGRPVLWEEVDLAGLVHRSVTRSHPLQFPTPELVWGFDGGMYRLSVDADRKWQRLARGRPVALGLNDIVINVCDPDRVCERVWYDITTGEQEEALYGDGSDIIEVRYGATLSPDGRLVQFEDDRGGLRIYTLGNQRAIPNDCVADGPTAWSGRSELLACATTSGVAVYDTTSDAVLPLPADLESVGSLAFVDVG